LEKITISNRIYTEIQLNIISKHEEFGMMKNRRSRINKEGKEERGKNCTLRYTGRRNKGSGGRTKDRNKEMTVRKI